MADTIAAVATGGCVSAIGIIRLSGDGAIAAADAVFRAFSGEKLKDAQDRRLIFGSMLGPDGSVMDEGLAVVSHAPASYTGEDTAELQCHGSPAAMAEILRALFAAGARQAKPGEFTRRAFLNGKLGLIEAEAVIDLIEAQTAETAKNAAGQLMRAISARTDAIYSSLLDIMAHFHAVLDWPDEDIEPFEQRKYVSTMTSARAELERLLLTFERGRVMKDGAACAMIGRPNVGKSSLLNALAGFERAIVTPHAGTTRDTLEEKLVLGGRLLRLTDTAGIRDSGDDIEMLGVERAERAAESAELVLAVFDGSREFSDEDEHVLALAAKAPAAVAVINKKDLPARLDARAIEDRLGPAVRVCAVTGEGLQDLAAAVADKFPPAPAAAGEILTNARQAQNVRGAIEGIDLALSAMNEGLTPDAALTGVEQALEELGELTGKSARADTVDRIFERFCVGK